MKRKLKLTITKIRRQTTRHGRLSVIFCPICERESETLTAAESIAFLEIENPMLDTLIAGGKIHSIETVSGNVRVCKNSIFK